MKKLLLFLPIFLGIGCVGWLCGDTLARYDIENIRLDLFQSNLFTPLDSTVYTGDSLVLHLGVEPTFIANAMPSAALFMNTAYALSCPDSGEDGIVDAITDIQISSNAIFNEFAAGEALNPIIDILGEPSFEDYIREAPSRPFQSNSLIIFILKEKPDQAEHTFSIQLTFDSGRTLLANSSPISWN